MRGLLFASALLLAGCATTPNVGTDCDPTVNFAKYRTYSWVYTAPPQGMNPFLYDRVRASIDRVLAARGYTQASPGDFAVAFTLGRRDRVQVNDFGSYGAYYPGWGRGYRYGWAPMYRDVEVRNVTDGSLAIDFYDTGTKRPIWHGVGTQEVTPGQVDQATIDKVTSAVIARFPPQPGT